MIEAGFVHLEGSPYAGLPNKTAFAKALYERADGRKGEDLKSWERKVNRWTSEENPGGMNDESAILAARVLGLPEDELTKQRLSEALVQKTQQTDAVLEQALEMVELTRRELRDFRERLSTLEDRLGAPRSGPEDPEASRSADPCLGSA